jgi:hypothetical protein
VLDLVCQIFASHHDGWARGAIARPVVVDAETWRLFATAAADSGDALFNRVVADAESFLPSLLYPRTYASRIPAPDWRQTVAQTVEHLIRTNWHRSHA